MNLCEDIKEIDKNINDPENKGYFITTTILDNTGLLKHKYTYKTIDPNDMIQSLDDIKSELKNKSSLKSKYPIKVFLMHGRCPGDILCITPLVEAIKANYGDKILVNVDTPACPVIWLNNPHITEFPIQEADYVIKCDYGKYGVQKSNSWQLHFAHAFRMHFEEVTGIKIIKNNDSKFDCWPKIYLTDEEINNKSLIPQD
ncbi:MAG: hypothetical protein ACFFG0_09475, partial [Candidatus Thorarchaeota archaeon]